MSVIAVWKYVQKLFFYYYYQSNIVLSSFKFFHLLLHNNAWNCILLIPYVLVLQCGTDAPLACDTIIILELPFTTFLGSFHCFLDSMTFSFLKFSLILLEWYLQIIFNKRYFSGKLWILAHLKMSYIFHHIWWIVWMNTEF